MSRLLIKQVKYIGTDYIYESPELKSGVNIIEGENGSGKTTFSSLIYFCLGGNVSFFRKGSEREHRQIIDDNSNYAELSFIINGKNYVATRYFYKTEIGIISEDDVLSLPINRSKEKNFTFSDWILDKLGIKVVDIYQGSEYYKINLYDLMRLFYYDQKTATDKIYKRPDNENFITDSLIIRKAIFEILTGNAFEEYYEAIADYRKALSELSTIKALSENFQSLNTEEENLFNGKNTFNLNEELEEFKYQLLRLKTYRGSIKSNLGPAKSKTEAITSKRNEFTRIEELLIELKNRKRSISYDYNRVKSLHDNLILEVTHLKKIMTTNEKLNLFSPDTCPYCLKKAVKEENKCICGNSITDEQFQKFFYTKEEYFNILKSKQKNIETVDNAIVSYRTELIELNDKIAFHNKRLDGLKVAINDLLKGRRVEKSIEMQEVNDKIFEVEKVINSINQQIRIEKKREELEQKKSQASIKLEESKRTMKLKELESSSSMDDVIKAFNKKYYDLMKVALDDCKSARISINDYLPVINSGSYTEASSDVPKRLMYFFTLLHLSLIKDIKFPKFLMIDTPENIGIDDDKLIRALKLIEDLGDDNTSENDYQIILTTGENKYPKEFEENKFQSISKRKRLLQKRVFDMGT